jgi:hypothetical protein
VEFSESNSSYVQLTEMTPLYYGKETKIRSILKSLKYSEVFIVTPVTSLILLLKDPEDIDNDGDMPQSQS